MRSRWRGNYGCIDLIDQLTIVANYVDFEFIDDMLLSRGTGVCHGDQIDFGLGLEEACVDPSQVSCSNDGNS